MEILLAFPFSYLPIILRRKEENAEDGKGGRGEDHRPFAHPLWCIVSERGGGKKPRGGEKERKEKRFTRIVGPSLVYLDCGRQKGGASERKEKGKGRGSRLLHLLSLHPVYSTAVRKKNGGKKA